MAYQKPGEGFRGEVTAAAVKAIITHNAGLTRGWECPGCGERITRVKRSLKTGAHEHAEACVELRSDVANNL